MPPDSMPISGGSRNNTGSSGLTALRESLTAKGAKSAKT